MGLSKWSAAGLLSERMTAAQHPTLGLNPPQPVLDSRNPAEVFEDVLLERGATILRVELDEGEPLPASLAGIDAIVAMGGPMGVNDEAEHPWLVAEKALIARAVSAGLPFWGSCLGVQLFASALGARVRQGPSPEVGVVPVEVEGPPIARGIQPAQQRGAVGIEDRPAATPGGPAPAVRPA